MYAGRVVESGPVREIFNNPSHPYTQALLNSVPSMDERRSPLFDRGPASRAVGSPPWLPVCLALPLCRRPLPAGLSALVHRWGRPYRRLLEDGRPWKPADPPGRGTEEAFSRHQGPAWTKVVGWVKAVDDISFSVRQGRRWRWSASQAVARRRRPSSSCAWRSPTAGQVFIDGKDVHALKATI